MSVQSWRLVVYGEIKEVFKEEAKSELGLYRGPVIVEIE